ncbi:MAG: YqgE/AlgH family protein [Methylotenera sp.]|nr:YqgE/AlgH family protein [Methylotenera sp.]
MSLKNINLTGHFLTAMPNLTDPYFAQSVILICTHNQDGAMGIIINQPTDMTYSALYEKINVPLNNSSLANSAVLFGGPVQPDRGFVLHQSHQAWDSSLAITDTISLTTSKDILEAVALGNGPQHLLLTLGYAGWTPGQLEKEIADNAWLSVQADNDETLHQILFNTPHEAQLNATIALLGFDPAMLSDVAGHA